MRQLIVAATLGVTLGLTGCTVSPVHTKASTEALVVQSARTAIDEAYVALIALNEVILQNVTDEVWTKAQAQAYLDKSKGYRKRVDDARELLRAGDPTSAENQMKILQGLIVALHREVAAQARRKP